MTKKLKIIWKDGKLIDIHMANNPVASFYEQCIKHLKNIELKFDARQNPFDIKKNNRKSLETKLLSLFNSLDIKICADNLSDQSYLNHLHDLYFLSFSGDKDMQIWLEIHDLIHSMEDIINNFLRPVLWFDYKECAGPLIKKFDRGLLAYAVTNYKKGDCYLSAFELGKTLYQYYLDKEVNDVETICRICKPWLYLRPVLNIALEDNPIKNVIHEDKNFLQWLSSYQTQWCEFYQLKDWHPWELSARLPIGVVEDVDVLRERFSNNDYPLKIII